MNRVLITGAGGFIGSAVANECLKNGLYVYGVDILDCPYSLSIIKNPKFSYTKIDVFDKKSFESFMEKKNIDTIFHFAWIGSSGPLREDIDCQISNATMTAELMKSAKKVGCKRFICAGTIMEFESLEAVFTQGGQPKPYYIYGIGKQLAHSLCKLIASQIGIDFIWTHITNTYGVGECSPRLINSTIRKCINNEPLLFTSATQNYDFVYIDDVARAFLLIGQNGHKNKSYVIGSGNIHQLRFFLETIVGICNKNAEPVFGAISFTGVDLKPSLFSIEETTKDCGYIPQVTFEEGIKKTYEWLKLEVQ